ncbi:hypothetical protein JKP88DRAFT_246846 [Tribonema minus]|uniref:Uncharacterized protein n=1 Tax=Tribonema minus TaxID=303371 RepID=A0A835YSC7_9STRA|nr:hypothetical protein JKP88DRAFT_246846 [Tribonema minus]
MDIDALNSYLLEHQILEGELARSGRSLRDKRLPSGPTVVRPGATIVLRQGTGLHHGAPAAQGDTTGIDDALGDMTEVVGAFCWSCREPPKVIVQGPATALRVLRTFTKAVSWECARNLCLSDLLALGGFPDDQLQRFIPDSAGDGAWWRSPPVLDLQPDPLADPDSAAARSALQACDEYGLDGGTTALERFERVIAADAEEEEYEAKWSAPLA